MREEYRRGALTTEGARAGRAAVAAALSCPESQHACYIMHAPSDTQSLTKRPFDA